MSGQVQEKRKRKQPPTFQHYPAEQAKMLKKAWVEKARIKSKWAAEKRKLQASGVIPVTKKPWEVREEGTSKRKAADDETDDEDASEDGSDSLSESGKKPEAEDESEEEGSEAESDAPPPKRTKRPNQSKPDLLLPPHLRKRDAKGPSPPKDSRHRSNEKPNHKPKSSWQEEIQNSQQTDRPTKRDYKGKAKANNQDAPAPETEERAPSLRDLKGEAYDKKNLHSFRADPLHKHSGRGRFNARGRGGTGLPRGQPNMKLRMNYMLEKIKRDYAS